MLHQKGDGIAAFAATKTFIDFFGRRYGKRRALLIMKRTKAYIIRSPFFQFHKFAHYINNVDTASDLLYGIGGNQGE